MCVGGWGATSGSLSSLVQIPITGLCSGTILSAPDVSRLVEMSQSCGASLGAASPGWLHVPAGVNTSVLPLIRVLHGSRRSYIVHALKFCGNELWMSKFPRGLRNGEKEKYKTRKGGCEGRAVISLKLQGTNRSLILMKVSCQSDNQGNVSS